jgi:endonuclease YncB( thermonuclease family)
MRRLPLLFGGLLLLVAMAAAAMAGTDIRATVLSIGDGDTIRVLEDGKPITVRLACARCQLRRRLASIT